MPHREVTGPLTQGSWSMRTSCGALPNLETGKEEIEVLDARDLAVERFSKRPARNRSYQSGTRRSRRTHGAKSAHNAGDGARNFIRSCGGDGSLRPGIPPSPRPGRTGRRFSARPCVIPQVGLEKRRVVAPERGTGRPLGQSTIPNDYPLAALGRRLRSAIRS